MNLRQYMEDECNKIHNELGDSLISQAINSEIILFTAALMCGLQSEVETLILFKEDLGPDPEGWEIVDQCLYFSKECEVVRFYMKGKEVGKMQISTRGHFTSVLSINDVHYRCEEQSGSPFTWKKL